MTHVSLSVITNSHTVAEILLICITNISRGTAVMCNFILTLSCLPKPSPAPLLIVIIPVMPPSLSLCLWTMSVPVQGSPLTRTLTTIPNWPKIKSLVKKKIWDSALVKSQESYLCYLKMWCNVFLWPLTCKLQLFTTASTSSAKI